MKMKNKKAEQAEDKKKHKEQLKAQRKTASNLLDVGALQEIEKKPSILIVCEGQNTEPSYFKHFRLSSAVVKIAGTGSNTISVVKEAKKLTKNQKYDQVWCVFDADPKPSNPKQAQNFNSAVALAKKYKFGVAYSNQAFEYWLILHLDDHQGGAMNRSDYNHKINSMLLPFGVVYDGNKNKKINEDFFEILETFVQDAIKRAKRNYALFDHTEHTNPAQEESTTTVFEMVEELQKYI